MSLPPCKIVRGTALNIQENKDEPLRVLEANWQSITQLLYLAQNQGYPRVCFVGSSCMYPQRDSAMREEMLGTGEVYEGNALYSHIKLLGWQICKAASKMGKQFFVVIPSDIFGDPKDSHFIPQMMRKMHEAKEKDEPHVSFWGTGTPIRHPIYGGDFETCLNLLAEGYTGTSPINIATPVSYAKSIASIALDIQDIVGYRGTIEWDASSPDGQKVKILDNSRLMGGIGAINFTPWLESLEKMYERMKSET